MLVAECMSSSLGCLRDIPPLRLPKNFNDGDARMNRKLRDVLVLFAACLAFVWCVPSFGQVLKGSISGTVTDSTGAVVSGAQVKATETSTGVARTTTTDSSGLFRFNLIPPGS